MLSSILPSKVILNMELHIVSHHWWRGGIRQLYLLLSFTYLQGQNFQIPKIYIVSHKVINKIFITHNDVQDTKFSLVSNCHGTKINTTTKSSQGQNKSKPILNPNYEINNIITRTTHVQEKNSWTFIAKNMKWTKQGYD